MERNFVRECLDEYDVVVNKFCLDEPLSKEEEMVLDYFAFHLAEAIQAQYECYDNVARIMLEDDRHNHILACLKQGVEHPCYEYNLDCPDREPSGGCSADYCRHRTPRGR